MTETHTPLRLNAGDETRIMEDRPDGVCLPVCDVKCGGMSGRTVKEGEALATRIVQAVNSHHRLVEALREAIGAIEDDTGLDEAICCSGHDCGCRGSSHRQLLLHNLTAALKEAGRG